jgi:carboxyl-terminal processing protease
MLFFSGNAKCGNGNKVSGAEYPQKNTLQDKLFGLSKIWSEIKYNFVNVDHIKFDIDSMYYATIPKVIATTNDPDYYDELQKFLALFNDGHTQLIERDYGWNDINDYVPCGLIDIDNKIYFSDVKKNAGLDSTLVGAEIIEIEGLSTRKYIDKNIYPAISASTDEHRWFQAVSKIQGDRKGTYFIGKAKKIDGTIVPFSILRNGETTRTPNDKYWSWTTNTKKNKEGRISLDWNSDVAILDIRAFYPENIISKIDSLAALINNKAKGLIIDLRYNGGGSTRVARHLQKYLTHESSFLTFGSQKRINDSYGRSQGNYRDEYKDFFLGKAYKTESPDTVTVEIGISPFKCPVIILIGRYTFSAAEDFLINIYEAPNRPFIIGEPTGGSTGAPLMVPLPHGAMARICSVRMLYPYSKKAFVGKGIQPDMIVKQSVDDYLGGKDVVMENALSRLKDSTIEK